MKRNKLKAKWYAIKQRCFNEKNTAYKHYGERGLTLYSNWINDCNSFVEYLKSLPDFTEKALSKKLITLDRIDNNGNYEPGNLAWKSMIFQCRNRRKKSNSLCPFKGISIDNTRIGKKPWQCRITINKKTIKLGWFINAEEGKRFRDDYIKNNNLEGFIT